jgi:DNA-binding PadR family transcriptional regulator
MTKLVVLGILKRKPLHGYEIKRIIQEEMGDWTNIAFGSIYFALQQLTKDGCIKPSGPEKQNARPAKIVYEITPQGEKEFLALLDDVWKTHERQYYALDMALFFAPYVKKTDREKYLRQQLAVIKHAYSHVKKHREEEMAASHFPLETDAIFNHTLHHMKAEYSWLRWLLEKMRPKGKG